MVDRRTNLEKHAAEPLLGKLGETRRVLQDAQRQLRRGCVLARGMDALVADIDDLATALTGDRTFFHAKAHTADTSFRG